MTKLYAIHINNDVCPMEFRGDAFRFIEGGEKCEDCGADTTCSLEVVGKVMAARILRCTCGAVYTARPFTYGSRSDLRNQVDAGAYD